jgi:hypothetical protein
MPRTWNALFSAIPVTMPGKAIGKMTSREIVWRPKKVNRSTAKAAIVPSTSAIAVAPKPAFRLVIKASVAPWLPIARCHHSVVKPGGGHPKVRSALNEFTTTTSKGT